MSSLSRAQSWPLLTPAAVAAGAGASGIPSGGPRALNHAARRLLCRHYYLEGGWGWVVATCALLVHVLSHGVQLAAGVLVVPAARKFQVQEVHAAASSASDISAPGSPIVQNKQSVSQSPNADSDSVSTKKKKQSNQGSKSDVYQSKSSSDFPKDVMNNIQIFQRKQKKGTIDVWWLYDDGGLTLLLPYIISTRRNWANCKLRVFALANKQDELELEHRNMASLLAKFRIDYSDLQVIPDITRKPQESTQAFFDNLIAEMKQPEFGDDTETAPIPESELLAMKEKTNRHLRLRELLLEHSHDASLVVMTLPMPRKGMITAPLYMSWLELLTKDMPPFLLVRGNQTSVLTFYS